MGSLPANTMDKLAPANTLTSSPANNDELLTFDLFPDFPFEIRRQIWEIAVDDLEPRVVEICFEG